jgi:hypothetical protein
MGPINSVYQLSKICTSTSTLAHALKRRTSEVLSVACERAAAADGDSVSRVMMNEYALSYCGSFLVLDLVLLAELYTPSCNDE